jgi:hypothetical protein
MTSSSQKEDAPDDASIPVLTERLTLPPLELDTSLPTEPALAQPQGPSRAAVPLALDMSLPPAPPQPLAPPRPAPAIARPIPAPGPVPGPSSDAGADARRVAWTRIELELRSSILQAIADELPQQIDDIVRRRMNDAIERLLTQLVAETRLAVAASLRDIVDQAVRTEIARLRSQKR